MAGLLALHRRAFAVRVCLLIVATALIGLAVTSILIAGDPPDEPIAEDSEDFDGDEINDPIAAAPGDPPGEGGGIAGCEPGEVLITSGSDGSLIVRFFGRTCGDQFGHHLAVIRDLNLDAFDDLLIGAPTDETGHAFAFLGPFRDTEPIEISAENADFDYFNPEGLTGFSLRLRRARLARVRPR